MQEPFPSADSAGFTAMGLPAPKQWQKEEKPKRTLRGIVSAIVAAVAASFKWILLIFSKIKFLGVALTMLISIGAYTLFFGWEFAIGLVLLLLVHEYGHVIQLRREGIKATAPRFIPFLGAYIGMKEMPADAAAEARVGLAGPVFGTIASLVPLIIYLKTGSDFWRGLAYFGFFLQILISSRSSSGRRKNDLSAFNQDMVRGLDTYVGFGFCYSLPDHVHYLHYRRLGADEPF